MADQTLLIAALSVASAIGGGGVAFFAAKTLFDGRMRDVNARLEKVDKARQHASQLLGQARRQIEGLQKDAEEARRQSLRHQRAAAPAPSPEAVAAARAAEVAEKRAQLDLVLSGESTLGWKESVQGGFADTQPLSGFGPPVAPKQAA